MKAIRLIEPGRPLELQELAVPAVGLRDVLVRVKAAGICHSDAHYRAGKSPVRPLPTPSRAGRRLRLALCLSPLLVAAVWGLANQSLLYEGVTRLAIGSNLDEEARSLFLTFLTGKAERIIHPPEHRGGSATWIKPFKYIPEREVALYASYHAEGGRCRRCPHASGGLSADIRSILGMYDRNHPSTPYALVNLGDRLGGLGEAGLTHDRDSRQCTGWDEPVICSCRSCRMRDEVADV